MRDIEVLQAELTTIRDPGHVRLVKATAITLGVMLSTAAGWMIVHTSHASEAYLSVAVVLSLQTGNVVRDLNAKKRLVTTLMLVPVFIVIVLIVLALSRAHLLAVAGFVVTAGAAVWLRRYGARVSAAGILGVMSYFFTLFMQPNAKDLWVFVSVGVCAILAQAVMRAIMLIKFPARELNVLLDEMRVALLAVVHAVASRVDGAKVDRLLERVDDVGRAIAQWQSTNTGEKVVGISLSTLQERVLDARIDTEEACGAIRRAQVDETFKHEEYAALTQLKTVLSAHSSPEQIAASVTWADGVISASENRAPAPGSSADPVTYRIARALRANDRLRAMEPVVGERTSAPPKQRPPAKAPRAQQKLGTTSHRSWRTWSLWSRMALQVMIATSVASAIGMVISKEHWYWAALTAFLVFIGVQSRAGILTRAFRRVVGTVIGIVIGAGVVYLAGDTTAVLLIFAMLAVFGMLYFGPLNYAYMAVCVTVMLVMVYRMLGILDLQLLELRVFETLTGAGCGVLVAYLVLSQSSHSEITAQVRSYFTKLQALLASAKGVVAGHESREAVITALNELESAQAVADSTVSKLSTALMFRGSKHDSEVLRLMHIITRAAARLVRSAQGMQDAAEHVSGLGRTGEASESASVAAAIDEVCRSAATVREALLAGVHASPETLVSEGSLSASHVSDSSPGSPAQAAFEALGQIAWALHRVNTVVVKMRRSPAGSKAEQTSR